MTSAAFVSDFIPGENVSNPWSVPALRYGNWLCAVVSS